MVTTRIDLANLNDNSAQLLQEFFLQYSLENINFYSRDNIYDIWLVDTTTLRAEKQQIQLSHDVIVRERNNNKHEKRYEVINHQKLIGEGGFSKVYDVLATLAIERAGIRVKKNKKRVVKIQLCSEKELLDIKNEVDITQKAGSIHIKQPVIVKKDEDEYQCYMVMRKLSGTDLYAIIMQLYKNAIELTTNQRLTIAISALEQLKNLHDKGIVHRDIKPDNIMLDLNSGELLIFDFGLSKYKDTDDKGVLIGTPGYIPAEVFDGNGTTLKSDVFSLAIIIGMLFYADEPEQNKDEFIPYYFKNIFKDQKIDLNAEEKHELLMTLMQMGIKNLNLRYSAKEALEELRNIQDMYVNRKIDEMVANRPKLYLLKNGLFVNNIPENRANPKKPDRLQSCKF